MQLWAWLYKTIGEGTCTHDARRPEVRSPHEKTKLEICHKTNQQWNCSYMGLSSFFLNSSERWSRHLWTHPVQSGLRGGWRVKAKKSGMVEKLGAESSRQPERVSLLQQRGGKPMVLLKKPNEGMARTLQKVVCSATLCRCITETDAEEQLTEWQSRNSVGVCVRRPRELLSSCRCAGQPGQRDLSGGLRRRRCIHIVPHMTKIYPADSAFVCAHCIL